MTSVWIPLVTPRGRRPQGLRPGHRLLTALCFSLAIAWTNAASAQTIGWHTYDLPGTEGRAVIYLPPEVDQSATNALIVFLHGAGGRPHHYRTFVQSAARTEGVVVVLPESSSLGWGLGNDLERIAQSVALAREQLSIDPQRIGIAGHSAGGGMALLVGLHPDSIYNAVFQMSSPFVQVASLPAGYSPPIRQYYGVQDPNYSGARPLLNEQWLALKIDLIEQIEAGYGHSDWPPDTIESGFRLLRDTVRPLESLPGFEPPPAPCGNANRFCLLDQQFEVEVRWTTRDQDTGAGHISEASGPDSGVFWFFEPDNWELMVKVIDGCAVNGHVWVFAAATTDVGVELQVRRRPDGLERTYGNSPGSPAPAITDTSAFPCQRR